MLNMNLSSLKDTFWNEAEQVQLDAKLSQVQPLGGGGGVTVASYKGRGVLKRGVV